MKISDVMMVVAIVAMLTFAFVTKAQDHERAAFNNIVAQVEIDFYNKGTK